MSRSRALGTLSVQGLYKYDETLFEHFNVPENVNKLTAIGYIIMNTHELEVIYPDIDAMKEAIKYWCQAEMPIWNDLMKLQEKEYEPLENYNIWEDRHEVYQRDVTENGTAHESEKNDGSKNNWKTNNDKDTMDRWETDNLNDSSTSLDSETENITDNSTDNTVHSVAAFNAVGQDKAQFAHSDYETAQSTENRTDNTNSNTTRTSADTNHVSASTVEEKVQHENEQTNGTNDKWNTDTNSTDRDDDTEVHSHSHGNMGSFSFQELIKAEREIREFNIYQYIADSFKMRFCLLVY